MKWLDKLIGETPCSNNTEPKEIDSRLIEIYKQKKEVCGEEYNLSKNHIFVVLLAIEDYIEERIRDNGMD